MKCKGFFILFESPFNLVKPAKFGGFEWFSIASSEFLNNFAIAVQMTHSLDIEKFGERADLGIFNQPEKGFISAKHKILGRNLSVG